MMPTLSSTHTQRFRASKATMGIFVLITVPGFLCCFNSEQSPQWEEDVGRGQGHPTHRLGGFRPATTETMEIFVGLRQRNRPEGKGKGSQ